MAWPSRMRMTKAIAIFVLEHGDLDNETLRVMVGERFGEWFSVTTIGKVKRGGYDGDFHINSSDYTTHRGRRGSGGTSRSSGTTHRTNYSNSNYSSSNYSSSNYASNQNTQDRSSYTAYTPHFSSASQDDDDYSRDEGIPCQWDGGGYSSSDTSDLAYMLGRKALPFVAVCVVIYLVAQILPAINPFGEHGIFKGVGDWFFVQYWVVRLVWHGYLAKAAQLCFLGCVGSFLWGLLTRRDILGYSAFWIAATALWAGITCNAFAYSTLTYAAMALAATVVCVIKTRNTW